MQKLNRLISVILILSMLLSSFPMAAIAQDVSEEPAAEMIEAPAPAETSDVNLTVEIMRLPARLREAALLCWLQGLTQEEAEKLKADVKIM